MTTYKIPCFKCKLVRDGNAGPRVDNPYAAHLLLERLTADLPFEQVWVFYLNARTDVVGCEMISQGGLHGCAVTPKEVFRGAILASASAIVLGHNHPSGDATPSADDVAMTQNLIRAAEILGVKVLDHVIIGGGTGTRWSLRDTHPHIFV